MSLNFSRCFMSPVVIGSNNIILGDSHDVRLLETLSSRTNLWLYLRPRCHVHVYDVASRRKALRRVAKRCIAFVAHLAQQVIDDIQSVCLCHHSFSSTVCPNTKRSNPIKSRSIKLISRTITNFSNFL